MPHIDYYYLYSLQKPTPNGMMQHKICVLIIDSNPESLKQTKVLLDSNPFVTELDWASNSDEALLKVIDSNPDIILMEYPQKGKADKELLKYIKTKLTKTLLVFVSDSKENAASAIRNEVFNYILKPLSKEILENLIDKVKLIRQNNTQDRFDEIIENSIEEKQLLLQTSKGYVLIYPDEVLYCKADGIISEIYFTNNRVEIFYSTLSKLDQILTPFNFKRVSRSILINMKYIRKVNRRSCTISLSFNGKEYEVNASKIQIRNLTNNITE